MTAAEAKRIIHPDTTVEALAEIKGKNAKAAAVDEACLVACSALDKQIPKKPIEKFAFSDDIEAGLCPLCNEGVNEEMNFCSYCGQAPEWEK